MEVTFGKNEQATETVAGTTAPAPTVAPTAPVPPAAAGTAVATPTAVAPPQTLLLGDKLPSFEEIIIPRVNIVQNMGDLKDSFELGSLVYDQKTVLFVPPKIKDGVVTRAATPPVTMVVIGFRPTRYVEKTEGGARGLIVATEKEVVENGGTLDYKTWQLKKANGVKYFQPLADAFVAIERPESIADDNTIFIYETEGRKWALALWAMKGSVYTAAAKKVFFTARRMGILKKGGYPSYEYAITTKEEQWQNGNKAWIPICIPGKPTTPGFLEFVADSLRS